MCNPVALLATSAVVGAYGQVKQGQAAQRNANEEAAQLDYQARVEQDNALHDAQTLRRQGEVSRGQTLAATVASGVKVGQGSALDAERQVMQDSETDAMMAMLNGDRTASALRDRASRTRRAGRDARMAGNIGAFTSLLSAGSQGYKFSGGK